MNKKIIGVAAIILFLDQITKLFAESYLKLNKSVSIISHFFSLTLCHNEGVAWGLLANKPLLIAIGSIVAIVLIYHFIFCFFNSFIRFVSSSLKLSLFKTTFFTL